MEERLTKTQQRLIDTILKAIAKDPILMQFTQTGAVGKTFALKRLDEIFDANVKDGIGFVDNPYLTDATKKEYDDLIKLNRR